MASNQPNSCVTNSHSTKATDFLEKPRGDGFFAALEKFDEGCDFAGSGSLLR